MQLGIQTHSTTKYHYNCQVQTTIHLLCLERIFAAIGVQTSKQPFLKILNSW